MPDPSDRAEAAEPRELGLADAEVSRPVAGEVYNPARDRERARARLAQGSLLLLAGVLLLIGFPVANGTRQWEDMEGVAAALLPATLSVVGTAVGFYFGTGGQR